MVEFIISYSLQCSFSTTLCNTGTYTQNMWSKPRMCLLCVIQRSIQPYIVVTTKFIFKSNKMSIVNHKMKMKAVINKKNS